MNPTSAPNRVALDSAQHRGPLVRSNLFVLAVALTLFGVSWSFVAGLPFTGADVWPIFAHGDSVVSNPGKLFTERYLEGLWDGARFWRPALLLFSGVEWKLFGANPVPYHFVRLGLFLAAALLVAWGASTAARGPRVAFLTAFSIYVLHPLQVETVPCVARVADTLGTLAMLGAVLLLVRAREARTQWPLFVGIAVAFLAPAFKEPALLAPVLGILVLEPWSSRGPGRRRSVAGSVALFSVITFHAAYRYLLLGTLGTYDRSIAEHTPADAARRLTLAFFDHQRYGWTAAAALVLVGLVLLLSGLAGPPAAVAAAPRVWRRLRLANWAWIALSVFTFVSAVRFRSRYAEALLAPAAMLLGAWIGRLVHEWRDSRSSRARLRLACVPAALAAVALAFGPGTPLVWSYPQWDLAGRAGWNILDGLRVALLTARETDEPVRVQSGRVSVWAQRLPAERGTLVAVDPFPYTTRQPARRLSGRISTVIIMGQQTIKGFVRLFGMTDVRHIYQGDAMFDLDESTVAVPGEPQIGVPLPPDALLSR